MASRPKKIMIIGLDAPIVPRLYKYCKEGKLPTLARVINEGVWAKNGMIPLPTITPPNWAAIATGAWPSTIGITDFNVHYPGDPLDRTHAGFFSGDVKAETVWEAIARAGKRSVLVNYPGTWPPTLKDGYQIGGAGVEVNMWFWPASVFAGGSQDLPEAVDDEVAFQFARHGVEASGPGQEARASLSYERLFSAKKFSRGPGSPLRIDFEEPAGWVNLPPARRTLSAELEFRPSLPHFQMAPLVWQMLALDGDGDGFDRVVICADRDAASPMAELRVGDWSPIITREFETQAGPKRAAFTMKLVALSGDAEEFRLYHSAICALDGWSHPESLAAEIVSEKGLPYPQTAFRAIDRDWFDADTVLEITELERQWLSDACTHILRTKPWDLFMMHYHAPDHAWHSISWLMDPLTAKSAEQSQKYQEVELAIYEKCDRLLADLLACVDEEETAIALVSDHGAKATNGPGFPVQAVLSDAGLLVRGSDGAVDWSQTKAIGQRSVYVYVNVKGRDPDGIVEPGAEYRAVQDQVVKALTEYVDPTTGRKPVLFALRKEDARFINIYGDYVGDVVYAVSEQFGGQHGPFLPSAEFGLGSLRGLFALKGPGIRKGVELERNVWCLDLVPTLCYLAGWPMPRDAEGSVIFQALEEPNPR